MRLPCPGVGQIGEVVGEEQSLVGQQQFLLGATGPRRIIGTPPGLRPSSDQVPTSRDAFTLPGGRSNRRSGGRRTIAGRSAAVPPRRHGTEKDNRNAARITTFQRSGAYKSRCVYPARGSVKSAKWWAKNNRWSVSSSSSSAPRDREG